MVINKSSTVNPTGKALGGPFDSPDPHPARKKEGHKREAYGLLACNRDIGFTVSD
jgi:hypothetical protein